MAANGSEAIAVVVVTHQSAEHLPELLATLTAQLAERDELVIVDNASSDGTATRARSLSARAAVIETGENLGFAGGCHVGVDATRAPLLLFVNPDSRPLPNCLERLRDAACDHPEWQAWQAAVLRDEERINSSGGVVHYLGIGWAGDCDRELSALPQRDREIAFPSGAAMVVRRTAWLATGGLDREYFMYGEDLDLGLRLWLAGWRVGVVPSARVIHSYEFDKGSAKWFWLERNRWRTVLSVYPGVLLALLAPALFASELGLVAIAARQGWLAEKLRAQAATLGDLPRTLARRRRVQRARRIGSRELSAHLTCSLESPYLAAAQAPWLRLPQAAYWRLVRGILTVLAR
ncbi:MAG TPA: glycosyltransferase family 2 protein [Solirubrobacteraceae bacterium]|nr:glycosyltransferase family 2 protein [Solirubrobacteraceae bacterium]